MSTRPEAPPNAAATSARDPLRRPAKQALFGVGVTIADGQTIADAVFAAARRRAPLIVEHLAVNNLVTALREPAFGDMLNRFDVVTIDGQGIRVALRLVNGVTHTDRVTARELMEVICARAAREGIGVYLYGDEPGTVARLRQRLLARFPGLRVVGCEPSLFRPLTDAEDAALVARITASGAAFVFVGLGCPRQERFVYEHRQRIPAVQLCVGSAFKFLAGERAIAPRWMQRIGFEWLHRLMQDPGRLWQRYLYTNAVFLYRLTIGCARRLFGPGRLR